VKGLYRELKRRLRGRVRHVDEFRTSIVCSLCDGWMDGRSRFWALKVCKDICLVSTLECLSILLSWLPNFMFILHQQTLWNRDVNAARNIRHIFLHMNANGGERLEPFCREPAPGPRWR
jgi:transposase